MGAKRTILERLAAGLLALVLIFGIVASADLAGLVPRVEAAEQAEYPDYHVYNRLRKDGLYTIHPSFDLGLALDITMDSVGTQYANTVLDDAKADPSQRFVIQLDEKKSPSLYGGDAIYGIRSVPSNWFIGGTADGNVQQRIANYRNETNSLWQFIYNGDGTVFIKNNGTGQYLYGVGRGNANVLKNLPTDGSDLSHFKWVLSQTHMPDSFFTTGTYWLQTRVGSGDGDSSPREIPAAGYVVTVQNGGANVSTYVPAAAPIINEDGTVTRDPNSGVYESQHFVIQKISGGFYSIINVSTGKYLAVGSDGGIVEGKDSGAAPAAAEKWIIYPGKASGNTDTAAWKFRIISAVDGSQLTLQADHVGTLPVALAVGEMQNAAVQDWFLKDIRLDPNNAAKGDTQIVGSGVYADTFNTENTVTLPIKIFDYAADGMLFEYASLDTATEFAYLQVAPGQGDHVISDYTYILVGQSYGDYTLNADGVTYTKVADGQGEYKRDPIYTAQEGGDYLKYRLGCNLGFSMLSCSKGGTNGLDWAPSSFGEGKLTWPIQNAGNGSAYFDYKYNDGLFFEFEGDDDVYLFINGQLVLDIGGAHAVTGTKLKLNDYVDWARGLKADSAAYNALSATEKARVDALALVEGHTYSFDFYYMERHGWGSNMRIFTNFQLASGEIEAEKAAAQAEDLSYGSVIDETQDVHYTFTLKNAGTSNLICPSFVDNDLGLAIGYDSGLTFSKCWPEKHGCCNNIATGFDACGGLFLAAGSISPLQRSRIQC